MAAAFDFAVIGGGMVGVPLAYALGEQGFRVLLLEKGHQDRSYAPSFNDRAIALSQSTIRFFQATHVWDELVDKTTPIDAIHVSEQGRLGSCALSAETAGLSELGAVVVATELGRVLNQKIQSHPNIQIYHDATLSEAELDAAHWRLSCTVRGRPFDTTAGVLIGSDGMQSQVRKLLGLSQDLHDYEQVAMVCNIQLKRDHENTAYERFTSEGPLAILPSGKRQSTVVWIMGRAQFLARTHLDDADFVHALQNHFGYRLGRFLAVSKRHGFPLYRATSERLTGPRMLLLGNAAQTLHPVAAQGYNLAIRQVAIALEAWQLARQAGEACGSAPVLESIEKCCAEDAKRTSQFAHSLVDVFSKKGMVAHLRGAGLLMVDLWPQLGHWIGQRGSGRVGVMPKLCSGIPLEQIG